MEVRISKPSAFFNKPVLRWLLLWISGGLLATGILSKLLSYAKPPDQVSSTVLSSLIYLSLLYPIWRQIQSNNLSYPRMAGKFPENSPWVLYLLVVLGIYCFQIGIICVGMPSLFWLKPSLLQKVREYNSATNTTYNLSGNGLDGMWTFIDFVTVSVIGPLTEEILFRGILFHRFARKWGWKTSMWVVATIFSLLHPPFFLHTFLLSLLLTLIYLKTRSLWIPILIHSLGNTLVFAFKWMYGTSKGSANADFKPEIFSIMFPVGLMFAITSASFLLWFFRKYWPPKNVRMPYLVNRA